MRYRQRTYGQSAASGRLAGRKSSRRFPPFFMNISEYRSLLYFPRYAFVHFENILQRAARFPKAGKLPATCGEVSQSWKASCNVRRGFPKLESFLQCAARFPKAGKLPAMRGEVSQSWKASCNARQDFPKLESFLQCAARFPKAGKLPAMRGEISQSWKASSAYKQQKILSK